MPAAALQAPRATAPGTAAACLAGARTVAGVAPVAGRGGSAALRGATAQLLARLSAGGEAAEPHAASSKEPPPSSAAPAARASSAPAPALAPTPAPAAALEARPVSPDSPDSPTATKRRRTDAGSAAPVAEAMRAGEGAHVAPPAAPAPAVVPTGGGAAPAQAGDSAATLAASDVRGVAGGPQNGLRATPALLLVSPCGTTQPQAMRATAGKEGKAEAEAQAAVAAPEEAGAGASNLRGGDATDAIDAIDATDQPAGQQGGGVVLPSAAFVSGPSGTVAERAEQAPDGSEPSGGLGAALLEVPGVQLQAAVAADAVEPNAAAAEVDGGLAKPKAGSVLVDMGSPGDARAAGEIGAESGAHAADGDLGAHEVAAADPADPADRRSSDSGGAAADGSQAAVPSAVPRGRKRPRSALAGLFAAFDDDGGSGSGSGSEGGGEG
jgi:hypothetical protein